MNWLQTHLAQALPIFPDEVVEKYVKNFSPGKDKVTALCENFDDSNVADFGEWMLQNRPDIFPGYLAELVQQMETEEAEFQAQMYPGKAQQSMGFILEAIMNRTLSFDDIPSPDVRQKLINQIRLDYIPSSAVRQFMLQDPDFRTEIERIIINHSTWDGGLLKDLGLAEDFLNRT